MLSRGFYAAARIGCMKRALFASSGVCGPSPHPNPTVDYNPFIKSRLVSRDLHSDLMLCKYGHVALKF